MFTKRADDPCSDFENQVSACVEEGREGCGDGATVIVALSGARDIYTYLEGCTGLWQSPGEGGSQSPLHPSLAAANSSICASEADFDL